MIVFFSIGFVALKQTILKQYSGKGRIDYNGSNLGVRKKNC